MFNYALLCEDVREEIDGKKTIVGLLPGDITIYSLPANIRVCFFVNYTKETSAKNELINFVVSLSDVEIARAEILLEDEPTKNCSITLPMAFLKIEKDSILSLSARIDGGPEEKILSKKIERRARPHPPSEQS